VEYAIYKYSAIVGCTLVVLQVGLQVFGLAGHTDIDGDHGDIDHGFDHDHGTEGHGNLFFGILSFKALCAFAGIFGLTGLAVSEGDMGATARVTLATGAGFAGMLFVAWMMRSLARLQASGTVNVQNAVGKTGTVYLTVPGSKAGSGKVTVEVQGRSMEFPAITEGGEIRTGTRVTVTAVEGDETLRVQPV